MSQTPRPFFLLTVFMLVTSGGIFPERVALAQSTSRSGEAVKLPRSGPIGRPDGPVRPRPILKGPDLSIIQPNLANRRIKPTWLLNYLGDRLLVASVPIGQTTCRLEQIRRVIVDSKPGAILITQSPPVFADFNEVRVWASKEAAEFVKAADLARTIRLQSLNLQNMQCAAPDAKNRLLALRTYVASNGEKNVPSQKTTMLKPAVNQENYFGYSWFQPFTVLYDGVSVQETRLRMIAEESCDASREMLEKIEARLEKRQICAGANVQAALNSPSGMSAYSQCNTALLFTPGFNGCVAGDGAGSGCKIDLQRSSLPYLMRPKNEEAPRQREEKMEAINATLRGVSEIEEAIRTAQILFSDSDKIGQAAFETSSLRLNEVLERESELHATEKSRHDQESKDLQTLAAEIARQEDLANRQTNEKRRVQEKLTAIHMTLVQAETKLASAQDRAAIGLQSAEEALAADQGELRVCSRSDSQCIAAIETEFNRSNLAVVSAKNAQAALRDSIVAQVEVIKLRTALVTERLALVQASALLEQTRALLGANADQHAKRIARLLQDQTKLADLITGNDEDRRKIGAAVKSNAALPAAPSLSCGA